MTLKSVIFDLDGTLVDSLPGIEHAVDYALGRRNYPFRRRDLRPLIGPPIRGILQRISNETDREALDSLEAAFREAYDSEGWTRTILQPGARQTLEWLSGLGAGIFVVTNKPRLPAARIIEMLGLRDLVSELVSPDSASPLYRSKAEMIGRLMERTEVRPGNSLVVGDTQEDVDAARSCGLDAVIVATGYGPPSETGTAGLVRKIQFLGELQLVAAEIGECV